MNKKILLKGMIMLGLVLGFISVHSIKAEAVVNDGFHGVKDTYIEAGDSFSTIQGISFYENGQKKNFSVYLFKSKTGYKRVSSTHFINTKVSGAYQLRFESANGKHKAWKKVYVRDTKAPMFSNLTDSTIAYGSKFSVKKNGNKNIIAYDLADGKRGYSVYLNGKKVSSKNYINTKKPGNYKLRYEVKDKAGNKTVKYRNIKVNSKVVKTAKKTTTVKKSGRTYHIYPKLNDERGFWYQKNVNRFYIHSYAGENLTYNKGDIVKFTIGGKTYQYIITDKFVCYAEKSVYQGVPKGMDWVAPTRNKYMKYDIDNSDLVFQTCMDNGYSKVKILTASPINGSEKWNKR